MDDARRLQFTVFGRVRMICDEDVIDLGRSRDHCLLGLLLVNVNRVVDIDTMIHLFWGDHPPRSARTQVRNGVNRLRKLTTRVDTALLTVGAGYQLCTDPLNVDLHQAIHLSRHSQYEPSPDIATEMIIRAMSLWQEPLLADMANDRVRQFARLRVGQDLDALMAAYHDVKRRETMRSQPSIACTFSATVH